MDLRQYKNPNGSIDWDRLALVTSGWTDSQERFLNTLDALKSAYRAGQNASARKTQGKEA